MSRPWNHETTETLVHTKIFDVQRHRRTSPKDGQGHDFFVLDAPDWVNVVALTEDGHMLLVEQWRHGTREVTVEIPAGMMDPGETPEQAARRELLEETGYAPASIEPIGVVEPNPAFLNNRCTTFLALGCRKVAETRFDTTEECVLRLEPASRAAELVRSGEINHALVVAAFGFAWLAGRLRM